MGLEDYKELVGTSASICTMGQMLSGTLVCYNIYKKKTSQGFDVVPFTGGMGMGMLMLQYAFILNDGAMINVNLFGLLTNVAYVAVFFIYAPDKSKVAAMVGKTIGMAAIFLVYAKLEHQDNVEFRYSLIITVLLLLLISAPLMNLGQVLRTKSTEILPFPLIIMGTLVSFQWFLYGIILDNSFIIFQNIVGFALYVVQLSLFAVFPSKSAISSKTANRKEE